MRGESIKDYTGKTWARSVIPAEEDIYKLIEPEWGKLYDEDGHLIYKGFIVDGMAFGSGTAYYPNGNICQEGLFGPKGLVCGRIFYDNGQICFEGSFQYNTGYGPNWPIFGAWYDPDGELKYYGLFNVIGRGGSVHMPEVLEPAGFGSVQTLFKGYKNVFGGGKTHKYYKLDLNSDAFFLSEFAVDVLPGVLSWTRKQNATEEELLSDSAIKKVLRMIMEPEGIAFLKEYRKHSDRYLPLVDRQYKQFDRWEEQIINNQCWGAGCPATH